MSNNENWLLDINQLSPNLSSQIISRQICQNLQKEDPFSNECAFFNRNSPAPIRTLYSPCLINSPSNMPIEKQQLFDDFPLDQLYKNIHLPHQDIQQNFNEEEPARFPPSGSSTTFSRRKKQNDEFSTAEKKYPPTNLSQQWADTKSLRPRDKGLRKLSARALQIVLQMRQATYKEVANKLVSELFETSFENDGKDQQNIKRRVYDALNVMIALGILQKEGRKIVGQKQFTQRNPTLMMHDDYEMINEQLQKSQRNVQSKKKRLHSLKAKCNLINNLIIRNKCVEVEEEELIKIPFIGTTVQDIKEDSITMDFHTFSVKSSHKLKPFGDVDSLSFISNINNMS